MKLKYKIMININANNLNKIPLNDLSGEIIEYALKKGFNYNNAVDNRYEQYIEYIIYNLERNGFYLKRLIDNDNQYLKDSRVKNIILNKVDLIQKDKFLKLIDMTGDIDYVKVFINRSDLSNFDIKELYKIIVDKFDYQDLPDSIIKNNIIIGKMYLDKNIDNINLFLKNNEGNYDVDEIVGLISDNANSDDRFRLLVELLKSNKVSVETCNKVLSNACNNLEQLMFLYNNFDFARTEEINTIFINALKNNSIIITEINDDNFKLVYTLLSDYHHSNCFIMKDYLISNNLVDKLIKYIVENEIDVSESVTFLVGICIDGNFLLTKDSPDWLKRDIDLVILSLKKGSITIKDIDLNCFINDPIDKIMELVDIGVLMNEDSAGAKKLREKINEKVVDAYGKNDDSNIFLNINEFSNFNYYDYIISQFENSVKRIYITDKNKTMYFKENINLFDVKKINALISIIKKQKKDIKLVFRMPLEEIQTELLQQISDLEYVEFESGCKLTSMSGKEMLLINKTLDLFVEDIKSSNLSPYERYIAIYNIVKSFKKYKEHDKSGDQSRSIYLILQNEYMVCVGYAELLHVLLKRVGIDSVKYGWHEGQHALNYVRIDDNKYGINGIFKSDSTNDNEIIDPINQDYELINLNIEKEKRTTPFDRLLQNDDEYIDKIEYFELLELYNYVLLLYPELGTISSKDWKSEKDKVRVVLRRFKQKYKKQNPKEIDVSKTIDAIIAVKQHIAGRKLDKDEVRQEKNWLIINNYSDNEDMIDYANDLVEFKKELFTMSVADMFKMEYSYKKYCFETIINKLFSEYNKSNHGLGKIHISCFDNKMYIYYRGVNKEQAMQIINHYNNIGVECTAQEIDGEFFVRANLKDILSNEIIGDSLFQKISNMMLGDTLSQERKMI